MTPINYQNWRIFFDITQFLISAGIAIYVWWSNREKVTNARFTAVEDRLKEVETAVKHPPACPHHSDLEKRITAGYEKLDGRMDTIHGDVREMSGKLGGLNRAVDLMNEYLINRRDK